MNKVKLKGFFFLGFVFILFKLKEGTPPYPRAAGPRAWRDARGELRSHCKKKRPLAKYAADLRKNVPPSLPIYLVKYALHLKCGSFDFSR